MKGNPATVALLLAALCLALPAGAGAGPSAGVGPSDIIIDGRFDDWSPGDLLFDAAPAAITRVWARGDRDRVAVSFELSKETVLQRDSDLVLYLDTDVAATTGTAMDGIGADLRWSFGEKEGRVIVMGLPLSVTLGAVGLRQAPTVSAPRFEVSFGRSASIAGAPLAPGDSVAFVMRVESGDAGGRSAFSTGRLALALSNHPVRAQAPRSLRRDSPEHLRLVTYNVLFDGCFERPAPFRRILRALDPDVLSLQEIYNHSLEETRALIAGILPDATWYTAGSGQGPIASRYPIKDSGPVGGAGRGSWALIEAPAGDLLVINPHPPCCEDDAGRRREFDAIAAWVRDARASGRLTKETPIVIAGDMNLVGESRQLRTLLTGAISDTATYGASAAPDGDGTPLEDAMPYHLTGREAYTWRGDEGVFAPGRLDYVAYSDSVLRLARSFVLWTPDLPEDYLAAAGLRLEDTAVASDHLPVVADFSFAAADSSR
jgi:endonuclease/exonuclease/phosphatase family metal-dependent hydrolase